MAFVTPLQAAKAVGVDRTTIYRLMSDGDLSWSKSANGKKQIDVSELKRVYPDVQFASDGTPLQVQQKQQIRQDPEAQLSAELKLLQVQLDAKDRESDDLRRQLREEKERHEQTSVEKARFLDMLEEAQKRIPVLPAPADAMPAEDPRLKRGFMAWLTGKA